MNSNFSNKNPYADIINLSRPVSARPKMSVKNRAAQFAPFAALEGHQDQIKTSERARGYRRDDIFYDDF